MTSRYFGRRRDFGNKKMMEDAEARQKVNAEIQGHCMDEDIKHIEDLDYRALELRVLAEQGMRDNLQAEMYAQTGLSAGMLEGKMGAHVAHALDSLSYSLGIARKYGVDSHHPMTPVVLDSIDSGWGANTPSMEEVDAYYAKRGGYMGVDWARKDSDYTGYTVVKGIKLDNDMTGAELRRIAEEFRKKAELDITIEPFKSSVENKFDHMLRGMAKKALLEATAKWRYQDFSDLSNTTRVCVEQLLAKGKDRQAEQEFMEAYKKMWIKDPLKEGMEKLITELKTLNSDVRYHVSTPVAGCRLPDHRFDDTYLRGVTNFFVQAENARDQMMEYAVLKSRGDYAGGAMLEYNPTCVIKLDSLPPLEDMAVEMKVVKSRNRRRDDLSPMCFGLDMASLLYQPIQGRVALTPEPTASDLIHIHALGDEPTISKKTMNNMNGAKLNGTHSRKWVVILGDFENPMCLRWIHGVNPDEAIVNWAIATGRFNSALDVDKRTFHTMKISVYSPKMFKKEAKRHERDGRGIRRSSTETE